MLQIDLFRIDDRLIHGQVMTNWLKRSGAKRIIIVDDLVAKDQFSLQIFKFAAPPGISVEAFTIEDAAALFTDPGQPDEKVVVLAKTPVAPLELLKAGVKFSLLNVGGMGAAPGRKQYYRNISMSDEELEMLREIKRMGVPVEFRILPDDKPKMLDE